MRSPICIALLLLAGCAGGTAPLERAPAAASAVATIREAAHRLTGGPGDYDPLMELVGDSRFVLLGEATHGTREFYRERARITLRLLDRTTAVTPL